MRNPEKEQEFLTLFDIHADTLFSYCFKRIPDRAQAHMLVEKTFIQAWDRIVEGGEFSIDGFYRLLDELVNVKLGNKNLPFPRFFKSFTRQLTPSS